MKRKLTVLAVFVIIIAILAGGTLAYFTDREQSDNVITTGSADIDLEEKQDPDPEDEYEPGPDDGVEPDPDEEFPGPGDPDPTPEEDDDDEWPDWPEDGESEVTPGQEISKVVYVTNNDSLVWVRVCATATITKDKLDENGDPVYVQATDENGEPMVDENGDPVYEVEKEYLPLYTEVDTDDDGIKESVPVLTLLDLDVGAGIWDWTYHEGYFYYNTPVDTGDSTSVLFSGVKFSEWAGNEYQNCTIHVYVYAEAVQYGNNNEFKYVDDEGNEQVVVVKNIAVDTVIREGDEPDVTFILGWPGSEWNDAEHEIPFDGEGKPFAAAVIE